MARMFCINQNYISNDDAHVIMPPKKKLYRESKLLEAVAAVKNGTTYKAASDKYLVPIPTIHDKCLAKYHERKNRPGK